jgi:hypothetical protein
MNQLEISTSISDADTVIPSKNQTKNWRKKQDWYYTGKRNECEKYQMRVIAKLFDKIEHTRERVNLTTGEICCVTNLFSRYDAFEWTENFDGKTIYDGKTVYFNFKFVVGSGGSQTRTMREVYHYIKKQNNHIFVNILDGNESYKRYKQFRYLMSLTKYVGDTYSFPMWYGIVFVLDFPSPIKNIIMDMCF